MPAPLTREIATSGPCFFCGGGGANGRSVEVAMSSSLGSSTTIGGQRISWTQKWIVVPRCSACQDAHDMDRSVRLIVAAVAAVALSALLISRLPSVPIAGLLPLALPVWLVSWGLMELFSKLIYESHAHGRKRLKHADQATQVVKAVSDGWTVGVPKEFSWTSNRYRKSIRDAKGSGCPT